MRLPDDAQMQESSFNPAHFHKIAVLSAPMSREQLKRFQCFHHTSGAMGGRQHQRCRQIELARRFYPRQVIRHDQRVAILFNSPAAPSNSMNVFWHAAAAVSNVVRASQGEHGAGRPLSGGWSRRSAHRWPTGYCSNADAGRDHAWEVQKSEQVDDRRVQPRFITTDLFSEKQVHQRYALSGDTRYVFSTRPQCGAVRSVS